MSTAKADIFSIDQNISITANPKSSVGKVGDKIALKVSITNSPISENVYLYISDKAIEGESITAATPYLKAKWNSPSEGSDIDYSYDWDTAAAGSNAGTHYITVKMTMGTSDITLYEKNEIYNLLASSGSTTTASPTASGGTDTTAKPDETTGTTPGSGGTIKATFNFGDLGTVIFPSTKIKSVQEGIAVVISWMLWLMGVLAMIAIVYSGIMYMTAGGDSAKAETGRKNLTWAIIGLVIVILSFAMVRYINSVFISK